MRNLLGRAWEKIAAFIALRLLPARIVYWCAIRVWAWASSGKYGREHAPSLKFTLALGRFERDHRLGYGLLPSRGKGRRGVVDLEALIVLVFVVAAAVSILVMAFAAACSPSPNETELHACRELCGAAGVEHVVATDWSNGVRVPLECTCRGDEKPITGVER